MIDKDIRYNKYNYKSIKYTILRYFCNFKKYIRQVGTQKLLSVNNGEIDKMHLHLPK